MTGGEKRNMENDILAITTELNRISDDVRDAFGPMTTKQLNWKPSADGWSIAQCVDHLIRSNEMFYPVMDRIASGEHRSSFLEKWSPLSGFFGRFLISSLKKDERKFKAPSTDIVPPSEIGEGIIEKFASHQVDLISRITKTNVADWQKTVVTSPFMKIMTYRLSDGYTAMADHEKRHLRQAKRVTIVAGFPN